MTYLGFHFVFLIPFILLMVLYLRTRPWPYPFKSSRFLAILLIAAIAFVYTTPWDNYLVANEIWSYGPDRVLGTIGYVPIEEYMFFILQPIFTGLWFFLLLAQPSYNHFVSTSQSSRWWGALIWGSLFVLGLYFLSLEAGTYMGLILVWASPILVFMWAWRGHVFMQFRKLWAVSIAVPTLYLWVADRIAIGLGIWTISERYTFGPSLFGLPLEEAVFFLVTNILCVQGTILFLHVRGCIPVTDSSSTSRVQNQADEIPSVVSFDR